MLIRIRNLWHTKNGTLVCNSLKIQQNASKLKKTKKLKENKLKAPKVSASSLDLPVENGPPKMAWLTIITMSQKYLH